MNLDFFHNLTKNRTKEEIKEKILSNNINNLEGKEKIKKEEVELAQKLDAIEEYTIDRFEENKAVLEDRTTKKIKNVAKDELPTEAREGTILKCINGKYFLNKESEDEISKRIEEKMNNLWND